MWWQNLFSGSKTYCTLWDLMFWWRCVWGLGLLACGTLTVGGWLSTYRSSFIFNGQLVQECWTWTEDWDNLIMEMAGTGYPKTGRQMLTSVRYIAVVWTAQTVDTCYVKSHCCCTSTSVTVRTQMSVPGRIVSDRMQKEICHLLEECDSAVQWDVCFMLSYIVGAGGL